jgi:hypothetical protein
LIKNPKIRHMRKGPHKSQFLSFELPLEGRGMRT